MTRIKAKEIVISAVQFVLRKGDQDPATIPVSLEQPIGQREGGIGLESTDRFELTYQIETSAGLDAGSIPDDFIEEEKTGNDLVNFVYEKGVEKDVIKVVRGIEASIKGVSDEEEESLPKVNLSDMVSAHVPSSHRKRLVAALENEFWEVTFDPNHLEFFSQDTVEDLVKLVLKKLSQA